ncbi:MAG: DUF1573 domain-containing protein [Bacteroidota bacterium]|nr:DUF1573 domain-containing protein [Bacteroidota bacterium]
MKLFIQLLSLGILFPAVLLCQPKVSLVGDSNLDFGETTNFSEVKRIVTIKNIGTDTLIISNVSSSCGCTAALMSNDHIPPSDSAALSITFDAKQFSGKIRKTVTMQTNDTSRLRVEIGFTANVVRYLELSPEYLFLRTVKDSATSQTITIKNVGKETVKFLSVTSSIDELVTNLSNNAVDPGEEVTLSTMIKPTTTGTITGNIEVKTDHPKIPSFTVRFFAWAKEDKKTIN